jgi:hypothetical protein
MVRNSVRERAAAAQYLVDHTGKKTSVLLPLKEYERLLEDLHDLAMVAERRDEPVVSLEELRSRLRTDAGL